VSCHERGTVHLIASAFRLICAFHKGASKDGTRGLEITESITEPKHQNCLFCVHFLTCYFIISCWAETCCNHTFNVAFNLYSAKSHQLYQAIDISSLLYCSVLSPLQGENEIMHSSDSPHCVALSAHTSIVSSCLQVWDFRTCYVISHI
jgi:hypothetical protein